MSILQVIETLLIGFLIMFSVIVWGSLLLHLFWAIRQIQRKELKHDKIAENGVITNKLSVVLAVANEEETIAETLDSILNQQPFCVEEIIVVISNSKDKTYLIANEYSRQHPAIKVVLTKSTKGKIGALIKGLRTSKNKKVVLIDSDVLLLTSCFHRLLSYHVSQGADYTTCIIDPIITNRIIPKFISCNRLFRQRLLRPARDYFGMSNIPGNLVLVNRDKYLAMLEESTGISDDICSTFQLIERGEQVSVLYIPLAGEKERLTLQGLILQRTRWAIGFLDALKYYKSAFKNVCTRKKFLLLSYPMMWYLVYLLMSILFIVSFFSYFAAFLFIIVSLSYFLCVYKAKLPIQKFNFVDVVLHALFFHFFVTIAFIKALYIMIVNNRTSLFYTKSLHKRS